ncbi:MAG TPA: alpha/beta hydrolase [Dehalococcoidia bacterium]|nr:alpha/beta hydrolase [Dehalococcoidia bacterium]HCL26285.1 alpha/beta hydrolase [Dehalococcoidia bacterium]|tara:strand:+ start:8342 stop:9214 length:873 start_codon:yes stop_codon:yes gene_type:complete
MFEGFENLKLDVNGTTINLVKGGSGPPLLMLHGYPQTHAMWNKIAPRLAEDFTVVCPDLRGYGESGKVQGDPEHMNYSKRVMAQDQADVMKELGFDQFFLVGHDRGARVSHRLTKDHQNRVLKLATLDIVPTRHMFQIVNKEFATNTYHWFFLIQPFDFPERVIGADPEFFARRGFDRTKDAGKVFTPEALEHYVSCFKDPGTIHAVCEDYRAGASIDLVHDEEDFDRKITCPMMALWSSTGYVGRTQDVLKVWGDYATDVRGHALPCGHYIAEELPDEAYTAIKGFLSE